MNTYIGFLRGINVGGHKRMKMADLKRVLEDLGLASVQTYIQSGNIVFSAEDEADHLRQKIEQQIEATFGFDVPVVLRTAEELDQIIEMCPFEVRPSLNVAFLAEEAAQDAVNTLMVVDVSPDIIHVATREVYILYQQDIRNTLLTTNYLEKKLKVPVTVRNWNTVKKLAEMAKG